VRGRNWRLVSCPVMCSRSAVEDGMTTCTAVRRCGGAYDVGADGGGSMSMSDGTSDSGESSSESLKRLGMPNRSKISEALMAFGEAIAGDVCGGSVWPWSDRAANTGGLL
jgi:hypothetical protein